MLWKKQTVSNVGKYRALVFLVAGRVSVGPSDFEPAFPWRGRVEKVQINAINPGQTDTSFYIECQNKEDYAAQQGDWQSIADQMLILPAGVAYMETPTTANVLPGDVFRLNFVAGDAANLAIQVIIKLESDI